VKTRSHLAIALLVMLACVGYFLWREHSLVGTFGFPLDDSWIHAVFARNLAAGEGFSYNPGVPVSGSTAPLWTLISATGYLLTGEPVMTAKVIGVIFLGLSVYFVYALVRAICEDPREALFAAIITASLPRLVWAALSGMEVTLAVALSLAGIAAHVLYSRAGDRRQYVSTLLLGLAALARPECAVFFVAATIDRVLVGIFIRWRDMASWNWLAPVLVHVALFVAVIAPFLIFSRKFGIGFLPNTAYAKAVMWNRGLIAAIATRSVPELVKSFTIVPFDYFVSFLHESLDNNPVLFAFAGVGFLRMVLAQPYREGSRDKSYNVPLAVVLFPLAVGVLVPFGNASYQEGRYAAPVAALMLILGAVGMYGAAHYGVRLFAEVKRFGRPAKVVLERSLIGLLMLLALSAQVRSVWYRGRLHAKEVSNIEDMQVTLGKWIDANLPEDAVVATNDLGAIAYFSGREILDTVGLISPEVLDYMKGGATRDDAVLAFLEDRKPDYAVVFPSWYPEMVKKRAIFEPRHRVVLTENVISGGDELVVYKLHWNEPGVPSTSPRTNGFDIDGTMRDPASDRTRS